MPEPLVVYRNSENEDEEALIIHSRVAATQMGHLKQQGFIPPGVGSPTNFCGDRKPLRRSPFNLRA